MSDRDSDPEGAIYKRNAEQSPILRLPAELRNKIYGGVLAGKDYRVVFQKRDTPKVYRAKHIDGNHWCEIMADLPDKNQLALVRTCRQIYKETKTIHAELSTFYVKKSSTLVSWNPPSGAKSIVVYGQLTYHPVYVGPRIDKFGYVDIASAYAQWNSRDIKVTVESVHVELHVWYYPWMHAFEVISPSPAGVKDTFQPYVSTETEIVRRHVAAVTTGVKFTCTVTYQKAVLFTLEHDI